MAIHEDFHLACGSQLVDPSLAVAHGGSTEGFEAATWQEASAGPGPGSQGLKEKQLSFWCFHNAVILQEHLKDLVDGKLTQAKLVKCSMCVLRTHIVASQASSAEGVSCPTLRCSNN